MSIEHKTHKSFCLRMQLAVACVAPLPERSTSFSTAFAGVAFTTVLGPVAIILLDAVAVSFCIITIFSELIVVAAVAICERFLMLLPLGSLQCGTPRSNRDRDMEMKYSNLSGGSIEIARVTRLPERSQYLILLRLVDGHSIA